MRNKLIYLIILISVAIFASAYTINAKALEESNSSATILSTNFRGGDESTGYFSKNDLSHIERIYDKGSYYGYKTNDRIVRKMQDTSGNVLDTIYCLDGTLEFPQDTGVKYNYLGELKDINKLNTKAGDITLSQAQKNALYWIFANVYQREDSQSTNPSLKIESDERKADLALKTYYHYVQGPVTKEMADLGQRSIMTYVTDDDWSVISQWLIWDVIEGRDDFSTFGSKIVDQKGSDARNALPLQKKDTLKRKVYGYLKTQVNKVLSGEIKPGVSSLTDSELRSLINIRDLKYTKMDRGFKLSNIIFNVPEEKRDLIKSLELKYYDSVNKTTYVYPIPQAQMQIMQSGEYKTLSNINLGEPFEIHFQNDIPEQFDSVKFEIKYKGGVKANVYAPETDGDKKVYQPVVSIVKNPGGKIAFAFKTPKEEEKKEADFALRKSIVEIDGIAPEISRLPNIDVSNLKSKINENGQSTTATYTHPKNPLEVKIGSTVKYRITVFNEGDVAGSIQTIKDKLPAHLSLKNNSEINNKYGWTVSSEDSSIIESDYLSGAIMPEVSLNETGGIIIYKGFVEVELVVNQNAVEGVVQTNIASIKSDNIDDRDSTPGNVNYPDDLPNYANNQEDDDDFEKVVIKKEEEPKKYADLALRKSITEIDGKAPEASRLPNVDMSKLNKTETTATYTHPKNPLEVKVGSIVKYRINVYNESDLDGQAVKIHDKLPEYLRLKEDSELNNAYGWKSLSDDLIETSFLDGKTISKISEGNIDNKFVEVELVVVETAKAGIVQTNIASIFEDRFFNENGDVVEEDDRDSTPGNVNYPDDLPNYANNQEDDDDFEKVILKADPGVFDLALRKFITNISNEKYNKNEDHSDRAPKVNVDELKSGASKTAKYEHPKNPLLVLPGDRVEFTLRIFNEGTIDGYATEVSDYVPSWLEFLPEDQLNVQNGWKLKENGMVSTDHLSKEKSEDNIIRGFREQDTLDYKDIKIAFKVKEDYNKSHGMIVNVAEITEDDNAFDIPDRDSTPGNKEIEDDLDYDNVITVDFDLALRKFVSRVTNETLNKDEDHSGRAPVVDTTDLKDGKSTTAKYTGPKDAVSVVSGDRVEFTLRVYNEGDIYGYATEIEDRVPSWLEFLPEDQLNIQYGWKIKEDGKIVTNYLSKEAGKARGEDTFISGFDGNELAFKDVKVAFKVKEGFKPEDGEIINVAEISEDDNDFGVPDRDSESGNDDPDEDDQDYDKLKTLVFDLALRKIVSKVIVNEDGKERVIETGHKYEDDPEQVAKVELKADKKDAQTEKTTVKWEYKIRVKNEGNVAGYAKEVTDYIPEGTRFVKEDNEGWYEKADRVVATRLLENTLLQPGESAELTIYLRWIQDASNMGVKTNWAEISEDFNEPGIPDRDSIPGNGKPDEDDMDDAPVALVIETGKAQTYYLVTLAGLTSAAGTVYIYRKKFLNI